MLFIPITAYAFSGTKTITIENIPEPVSEAPELPQEIVFEENKGNIPQRHNNPLNIKYGRATKHWIEEGLAKKGENGFLKFSSPKIGFIASRELLINSYGEYTVDQAMERWGTGNRNISNVQIKDLDEQELEELIQLMARLEGFYAK